MSENNRRLEVKKELPLPINEEWKKVAENIESGGEGKLFGDKLWEYLQNNEEIENYGTTKIFNGYQDWIVFLKNDGGSIEPKQIYSAIEYPASFVKKIVGFCETQSKWASGKDLDLPTVEEIREKIEKK